MRGLPKVSIYPRYDLTVEPDGSCKGVTDPDNFDGATSPIEVMVEIDPSDGSFKSLRGGVFLQKDEHGLVDGYAFARALLRLGGSLFERIEAEDPEVQKLRDAINLSGMLPSGNA